MKAVITLVALAIQVATSQSPDSAFLADIPTGAAIPPPSTIPVDSLPAAVPSALPAAPVSTDTAAVAPVAADTLAPTPSPLPAAATAPLQEPAIPASVPSAVGTHGNWQVGVAAGMASGSGLSIRRWFGEKDALQLNLAPYVSRRNFPEEDARLPEGVPLDTGFVLEAEVTVGLTWFHEVYSERFARDRRFKLHSYLAGSAFLSIEQQQMDRYKVLEPGEPARAKVANGDDVYGLHWDDYRREERNFRLGSGVAAEFSVWRWSAMLGLGLGGWYEDVSENFGVSGDVQVGTHFRF